MRDTELYRHLLGLVVPWEVRRVELSVDGGRVDVWAEHPKRTRISSDTEGVTRTFSSRRSASDDFGLASTAE